MPESAPSDAEVGMSTSRRTFLTRAIAGAVAAKAGVPGPANVSSAAGANSGYENDAGSGSPSDPQEYTRGVGVYPGDPRQDFGPTLVPADSTYRNLALRRPAYHSSSYDYNLTAQLVTDGIKDTRLPAWVSASAGFRGELPKNEREFFLDHNATSNVEIRFGPASVQVRLGGGESVPQVDRVDLLVVAQTRGPKPAGLVFSVSTSDDGRAWKEVGSVSGPEPISLAGYPPGFAQVGQLFAPSIALGAPAESRVYRVDCRASNVMDWQICEVAFFHSSQRVEIGGPYGFTSAWMSAGLGEEWVYVDLGVGCEFDRVKLYWIARATEGSLQVSDDAQSWKDIHVLPESTDSTDDVKLAEPVKGRYLRLLMKRPASPYGYILSELEVYGRGGFVAQPKPQPAARSDGRLDLSGGAWRLQRDSLLTAGGETLSKVGFQDDDWVVSTVPGTVLTSFVNVGALPDPNYADNQLMISDSFFYADFWYRNEFTAPFIQPGQHAWLNFDGINWKADVFLNGEKLGRIEGGFMRGRFDVTSRLHLGEKNALAVCVRKNATPGSVKQKTFESAGKNGGALGADNPTYHASIGWDWIPTIRGRNTGIWNDVYLTVSGPVTIDDPFVTTTLPLPDTSRAAVKIEATLVNHSSQPLTGTLRGRFGEVGFAQPVKLNPSATQQVTLDPASVPALRLKDPQLWWPAGYGEAHLYTVELKVEADGAVSDQKSFQTGVRQMSYSDEGGALRIWINGRRFVPRGGNWGFGESMLRYRGREYDVAVGYHRDMNFTMIRNWVGQVGEDEFYEACDRHGVMVWQDFWLANPWDGPDPDDDALFLRNVRDTVLRLRNHPSIGLYVGRNEGYPPPLLESGIRQALAELHPGLHYIPSSADDTVSGHGPYMALPPEFYFAQRATTKIHSELGMPNIPPMESVRAMMPESALWPQGLMWGLHDFCLEGAQGGDGFRKMIETRYGGASNVEEWVSLAQFVNYEGHRAMFEAQGQHRMGLLIWMSHPCWPSFVWQTYDYYFEPTAAYFGCKKASEPLHIQWNPVGDTVEVVNYSAGNVKGMEAQAEVLNLDGARKWYQAASLDSAEDSVTSPIRIEFPSRLAGLSDVHFIRLKLVRGGDVVSENFYWRGLEEGNCKALRELPKVKLEAATHVEHRAERRGERWRLTTELHNPSPHPALMVRLKAVRQKSRDRILPALYSDNYVALMPGERRTLHTELVDADTRGESPEIVVEGFNATI